MIPSLHNSEYAIFVFRPFPKQSRIISNRGQGTYGNLDTVIGEDEGRVGASELGSRHGGRRGGWTGLESREGWG